MSPKRIEASCPRIASSEKPVISCAAALKVKTRPSRSVVTTPDRIEATMRSLCSARNVRSDCLAASSRTSERDCRSAKRADSRPTTRNAMSNSPTHWTVCDNDPPIRRDGEVCPKTPVSASEHAENA